MNRNEAISFIKREGGGASVKNWGYNGLSYDRNLYMPIFPSEGITTAVNQNFEHDLIKCLQKISIMVGRKFAVDVGYETLPDVVAEALLGPQKTYWDGVEPLRVGHIVAGGEIVAINDTECCVLTNNGLEIWPQRSTNAHPFAKYTSQERHFLSEQLKAGVIKLC